MWLCCCVSYWPWNLVLLSCLDFLTTYILDRLAFWLLGAFWFLSFADFLFFYGHSRHLDLIVRSLMPVAGWFCFLWIHDFFNYREKVTECAKIKPKKTSLIHLMHDFLYIMIKDIEIIRKIYLIVMQDFRLFGIQIKSYRVYYRKLHTWWRCCQKFYRLKVNFMQTIFDQM